MSHIDEYAIVTNGILTRDDSIYRIIDPLGYFVIQISEEIVEEEIGGGGALDPRFDPNQTMGRNEKEKKHKKKIIRVTVISKETGIQYTKEIEVRNIDLKVTKAELINEQIRLTLYNPVLKEYSTRIINVRNVKE
jgi:hypothetical protein